MLSHEYAEHIHHAIDNILNTQSRAIEQAAELVRRVIEADGLIYIFGCGHSHILAEECFYRAGGLACTVPIFYEPLMLHESASESSHLEKQSGLAPTVLAPYKIEPRDMLICISTSDKNAVPVELCQAVRDSGVPTVGISSSAYFGDPVSNACGKHLHEVCGVWIDNCAPHGDACLSLRGAAVPMTPLSTVTGAFILNSILAEGAQMALDDGAEVPIYLSGNIPNGAEYNHRLIERYSSRMRSL